MEYKLIAGSNEEEFINEINEYVKIGWYLEGNHQMSFISGLVYYSQLMAKHE